MLQRCLFWASNQWTLVQILWTSWSANASAGFLAKIRLGHQFILYPLQNPTDRNTQGGKKVCVFECVCVMSEFGWGGGGVAKQQRSEHTKIKTAYKWINNLFIFSKWHQKLIFAHKNSVYKVIYKTISWFYLTKIMRHRYAWNMSSKWEDGKCKRMKRKITEKMS